MSRHRKRAEAKKAGFRSGFEKYLSDRALAETGVLLEYEPEEEKLRWQPKPRWYTPDFRIPGTRTLLESKGQFTSDDRTKILSVIAQNPGVDLRMVLQRDNRLSPVSDTTYSMWCRQHNIPFAMGAVPKEWLITP